MSLYDIAAAAADHLVGRLLRRVLLASLAAGLGMVAFYHFTIAGTLALQAQYGALEAQLIVAAIYAAVTLIALAILWSMGRKTATRSQPGLAAPREMQMAMLVEAVMLGYQMGKKRERAN